MEQRTIYIAEKEPKRVIHCSRCGAGTIDPKYAPTTLWENLPLCSKCHREVSVGPQEFKGDNNG